MGGFHLTFWPPVVINLFTFTAVPVCDGEYNFTFSVINSTEYILHSKLRLYLERFHHDSPPPYIVEIRTKDSNGVLSEFPVLKEIYPTVDDYIEFEVADLMKELYFQGGKYCHICSRHYPPLHFSLTTRVDHIM